MQTSLGPIMSDDLQIHILNGAIGVDWLTKRSYTPDILHRYATIFIFDMPFPFFNCYPGSNMKSLLKKLMNKRKHYSPTYQNTMIRIQLAHQEEERKLKPLVNCTKEYCLLQF